MAHDDSRLILLEWVYGLNSWNSNIRVLAYSGLTACSTDTGSILIFFLLMFPFPGFLKFSPRVKTCPRLEDVRCCHLKMQYVCTPQSVPHSLGRSA